ncbi:hypothetical protein MPSEU_000470500 [Mayamaea pseudoterrestris]|nr:hypothetical protein MPSEU_000470500 [Mayamaea pseudoterrestris]
MPSSSNNVPMTIREEEPLLLNSKLDNNLAQTSVMPLNNQDASGFATAGGDEFILRSQRSWIIKVGPIKKYMFKGHLIRSVRLGYFGGKRRKLSVQVQAPHHATTGGGGGLLALSRLFGGGKQDGEESQDLSQTEADGVMAQLSENDVVWIKVYKKPKQVGDDDDDASVGTDGGTESMTDGEPTLISSAEEAEYSVESDAYELSDLEILERKNKTLECKLGTGNETVVRELRFRSAVEADAFARVYSKLEKMVSERTQEQLAKFRKSSAPAESVVHDLEKIVDKSGEAIAILCEIVSAQSLPIADMYSTDPYIIVRMGRTEIHRTAHISKNRDPIWTIRNGSLFLLEMTPEEFFSFPSMSFVVKDFDQFGSNEILGAVHVPLQDLLTGTGERKEYVITPRKGFRSTKDEDFKPRLYLRFRRASKEDILFMQNFEDNKKAVGVYVDETFLRYRPPHLGLTKRLHKKGDNKEILNRVRPFPDPDRPEDTKWMTKDEINQDSLVMSKNWVEAGSGGRERVGRVYLEILGCDKLPNMDSLTLDLRDATDAFVSVVFEDAIVSTDVIANTLSPRWPSWSQRAFAFNVAHPSSDLILAVFDYDPEASPLQMLSRAATTSLHDAIGRVQVNLSAFHANTVYTLCYPLYYGEKAEEMTKSNGKVWIRLRKEWVDVRRALVVAALPPHPPVFVTVARPVDYQVAHYTTEGAHVETDFSLSIFTEYIQELQSYTELSNVAIDAFMAVWLWRGHYPVTFRGRDVLLPLHSITAYIWAIVLTRNFNTLPSFVFFAIGWGFLATNEHVNQSPSVWHRTPHFLDGLRLLLNFRWTDMSINIDPNYNAEAVEAYQKAMEDRVSRRKHEKELELQYDMETKKRLGVVVDDAEAEDAEIVNSHRNNILSKVKDLVNPMTLTVKPVLHPIQLKLRSVIIGLRITKSIIMWDDFYYAWWITFFCFAISIMLVWIPWGWMMRWLLRVIAWVGFGPWMMLVDQKYFAENPDMTEKEREELIRKKVETRYDAVIKAASDYQVRKERIIKLKSMSTYMFGRFHLRVPRFNEDLITINPLPESYAKAYDPSKAPPIHFVDHKYGQRLEGDMIPMRDIQIAQKKKAIASKEPKKTHMQARAGKALGRFRKSVAPLGKRVVDGIADGEHLITDNVPLLGRKSGQNGGHQTRNGAISEASKSNKID